MLINLPRIYYNPLLIDFINSKIDQKYRSFDDLEDHDQHILLTHIISIFDDEAYFIFYRGDSTDKLLSQFKRYLITDNHEDREDEAIELLKVLKNNAIESIADDMNHLFDELLERAEGKRMMENGYMSYQDNETGEYLWRKMA